ncbi:MULTISPECIES: redoxin domain-containing protein [Sutcliffiella]|uniref:redoxin domain-containing protein n=1 Tax=Sutcliffiella TaxID=2837511 RepID=UPI00083328CC|nr:MULTISPECIES: redoxin domain-containing protein [Sutcliffiella]WBL13194.1 redoxin domain-containing protein [Sutcliffiella sp. NC1]
MIKKLLAVGLLLCLVGVALVQVFAEKDPNVGASVGDQAYDFDLAVLSGDQVKLSDYRGKKVIVNFWATWCGPCKDEMPEMQLYYEDYKDEVEILAVNITSSDTLENVEKFVEAGQFTYPILLDENRIFAYYEVLNMPATFFINEEGVISARHEGPLTYSMLDNYVNKIK